jgi:hypothetical protein
MGPYAVLALRGTAMAQAVRSCGRRRWRACPKPGEERMMQQTPMQVVTKKCPAGPVVGAKRMRVHRSQVKMVALCASYQIRLGSCSLRPNNAYEIRVSSALSTTIDINFCGILVLCQSSTADNRVRGHLSTRTPTQLVAIRLNVSRNHDVKAAVVPIDRPGSVS